MGWTVRTPDGSLDFATIADLARAYRHGLVGPEDELRDGPDAPWRRAGAHPLLRGSEPKRRTGLQAHLPVVFALLIALAALSFLVVGQWGVALALSAAVTLYLMRQNRRLLRPAAAYSRR